MTFRVLGLVVLALAGCRPERGEPGAAPGPENLEAPLLPSKGLRAVRLDSDSGLELQPGDRVDVLASVNHPQRGQLATTLAQAVRVLRAAGGAVGLELLPEDAERITLAREGLSLTRRAAGDVELFEPAVAGSFTLLGGGRAYQPYCRRPGRTISNILGVR